jgi:hypothetical protein
MNYELGSMDSMGMNDHRTIARLNGGSGASYDNDNNNYDSSSIHVASKALAAAAAAASANEDSQDILPTKDDEVKRWSCDMDSNILF